MDPFELITATQRKEWNRLVESEYGGDPVLTRAKFVQRLASQLDKRGPEFGRPLLGCHSCTHPQISRNPRLLPHLILWEDSGPFSVPIGEVEQVATIVVDA